MPPKRLPTILTRDEADALLRQPTRSATTGLRNLCMLELMLRAGLRVSEVVKLRPRDIRWRACELEVRGGKGGRDRVVPLRPSTVALLERWRDLRPTADTFFCTMWERGGIASGGGEGKPLSSRYVQQAVKRYAHRASIERRVTPHTLRHTYATDLLDGGLNIREVQQVLGHSDVSTTMIYTHVRPEALAAKIAALDAVTTTA